MGRKPDPEVRLKRAKLLELCRAGVDDETIAQQLGYKNGPTVRAIYWEEINKRRDTAADDCLAVQLDRTEALIQGAWSNARRGNEKAASVVFKGMEHEAKLRGISFSDKLDERRTQVSEDVGQQMIIAMNAFADAIGLTAEQQAVRESVIQTQIAALAGGIAMVSLRALIDDTRQRNETAKAELMANVLGATE